MVSYISSGLSIRQCAAKLAEENKTIKSRHFRNGPYGSTNAETLERQIKREKKRMADDPDYRKLIEFSVAMNKQIREGTFLNKVSRDISKQTVI